MIIATTIVLTSLAVGLLVPEVAHATNTPMGKVLCSVTTWFTGNTGKGLATLAACIFGVMARMGKVTWGGAPIGIIGIAILFGAANLVDMMNAGAGTAYSTS